MDSQQDRAAKLFEAVVELPSTTEREAYLDVACGEDSQLRAEVEELLVHDRAAGSFLSMFDWSLSQATVVEPIHERPSMMIGPYKLLQQIGEGGMGVVWMAEQEQPVRRKVALKIIKPGMDSCQVIARFEAERQALALMDHHNIAKVFDAGTTESGRPFFVMELIHGIAITQYCDDNQLTPRERLELFVTVCQAIQHAHQKGIIHRDIKPSNVLVTQYDGKPAPKVIDFGVAKAVEQRLTEQTLFTQYGTIIGTLEYMSPEQAELSALGVDTRSDIYSLGVLLYELLTGTTPLERQRLREASYPEIMRLIREEEAPRPSTRLGSSETLPEVAAARKTEPAKLAKLFRELDWIVMKALEKDRNRRYETASAFAADVQRYLHDEPVQACPPSQLYRLGKFARRNKTALTIVGLMVLFVLLLGGGGGWVVRDRIASRQALDDKVAQALHEAEALIEKRKWLDALAIVQRTETLLLAAGRTEMPQTLVELRKDLEMVLRLETIYGQPRRDDFWNGQDQDDSYSLAFQEHGIDVSVLSAAQAAEHIRASKIRQELARGLDFWAHMRKAAVAKKPPTWQELLQIAEEADDDPARNEVRQALRNEDRAELERLAAAADIRLLPADTLVLLGRSLALYANDPSAPKRAETLLRQARVEHPTDLWVNDTLGLLCLRSGQLDDAARFYQTTVVLRPNNPHLVFQVALALYRKGARQEATALFSKAIELGPSLTASWLSRADLYREVGEEDKALADYDKAIELDPKNATVWFSRGLAYQKLGRKDKALADYSQAIEVDPKDFKAWYNRGKVYGELGQWNHAVADYSKAIERAPHFSWAHNNRGHAYQKLGQQDEALTDFFKAIELDPKNESAWVNRGHVYQKRGRQDKALADYSKAIELTPKDFEAWYYRGISYSYLGQWDKALADYSKAIEVDPKDSFAWNNRSNMYRQLGEIDKAIDGFSKAIELNPKHVAPYRNLARLFATSPLESRRQPKRTVELAKKAIELEPNNGSNWNTLGVAQYRCRDFQAAIAALQKSMALRRGGDSFDWFILAMAHWQLGNQKEARTWYDKAVAWQEKNRTKNEELGRFQAEAEKLLDVKEKK
jgi:tetratricopeptide (TPR) repeat protein/serine/threonine protein kinase